MLQALGNDTCFQYHMKVYGNKVGQTKKCQYDPFINTKELLLPWCHTLCCCSLEFIELTESKR